MTIPEPVNVSALELYRQGARVESKVDRLDERLGGHAETLARHDSEIRALRHDVEELTETHERERAGRVTNHWALASAITAAIVGALLAGAFVLLQIALHH